MRRAVQQYVSLAEGAEIVGVSVDTLRRRIRKGRLPAVRDGKIIRILIDDLYGLFTPIPTVGMMRAGRSQGDRFAGAASTRSQARLPLPARS